MFCEWLWPDWTAYDFDAGGPVTYTWPDPDPEGPLVKPLALLARLIALTPTFRARARLAGDDVADDDPLGLEKLLDGKYAGQKRIFYPEADWDRWFTFPGVVVQFGPAWNWQHVAAGNSNYLIPGGNLRLIVIDKDRKKGDVEASLRDFGAFAGNVVRDACANFAKDAELAGVSVAMEQPPAMSPIQDEVSRGLGYWSVAFLIGWE